MKKLNQDTTEPTLLGRASHKDSDSTDLVTQKNYLGEDEKLPASKYCFKLICSCSEVRYYSPQDRCQVEKAGKCKPCLRNIRLNRRKRSERVKVVKGLLEDVV